MTRRVIKIHTLKRVGKLNLSLLNNILQFCGGQILLICLPQAAVPKTGQCNREPLIAWKNKSKWLTGRQEGDNFQFNMQSHTAVWGEIATCNKTQRHSGSLEMEHAADINYALHGLWLRVDIFKNFYFHSVDLRAHNGRFKWITVVPGMQTEVCVCMWSSGQLDSKFTASDGPLLCLMDVFWPLSASPINSAGFCLSVMCTASILKPESFSTT